MLTDITDYSLDVALEKIQSGERNFLVHSTERCSETDRAWRIGKQLEKAGYDVKFYVDRKENLGYLKVVEREKVL